MSWYNKVLLKLSEAERELPIREGSPLIDGLRQSLSSMRARIKQEKSNVNESFKRDPTE